MRTAWEEQYAYSRVKVSGPMASVAGTIAMENGALQYPNDAYAQSMFIFQKMEKALAGHGFCLDHVVRTTAYVTDIGLADEVGRAHAKHFKGTDPAMSMVEVSALIHPEALVEIELTAWK